MFTPSTNALSRQRKKISVTHKNNGESTNTMTLKPKKVKINLDNKCDEAEETNR